VAQDMAAYQAKVIANMEKQSGKKLQEFVALLRATGIGKHKEQVAWLKEQYGLGNTQASIVAWEANKSDDHVEPTGEEILAAQYKGKESLKPIYEKVLAELATFGQDWELKYCQGYVAVIRGRQFLAIQPSTKTRVDLGLVLPGMEAGGRLLPAKNVGSGRTSHTVSVTTPDEVDAQVTDWLRMAYVGALKTKA
jgi:hypothetical protein